MKVLLSFIFLSLLVSPVGLLHLVHTHEGEDLCHFLPENDLYIGPEVKSFSGVTQGVFNALLDEVESVYAPIVASKGARLVVRRLWENGEVNARAYRQGSNYVVEMYGGLARHPEVTRDAVALVACHEVGHHLGGAPKYSDAPGAWASVEGQSDYFAVTKCLRKVFKKFPTEVLVDPIAQSECKKHSSSLDQSVCMRSAIAGLAMARAMAQMSGAPSPRLDLKDPRVVSSTFEAHPQPQCRMDTYFQGSLCRVSENTDFSDQDPNRGACLNGSSEDFGSRPLCWFKPQGGGGTPNPTPYPSPGPQPDVGVADMPTLNGSQVLNISNPSQVVTVRWNVRSFANAAGVYVEISRPNQVFSNPNDTAQDPNAYGGVAVASPSGQIQLVPQRHLPGWGRYQIRVIPLDRSGRKAVGRFSNPATLQLGSRFTVY